MGSVFSSGGGSSNPVNRIPGVLELFSENKTSQIKELVDGESNFNINSRVDEQGNTGLHWAVHHQNKELIHYLLDHGADIDAVRNSGSTPLLMAARDGYLSSVKVLIARGANVSFVEKNNSVALMVAGMRGHIEIFKHIHKHLEKNKVSIDPSFFATLCVSDDNIHCVKYMLEKIDGATEALNPVAPWKFSGLSPLMVAAAKNAHAVAKYLIKKEVDVDIQNLTDNGDGWTALFYAFRSNAKGVISAILKAGGSKDIVDTNGRKYNDPISPVKESQTPSPRVSRKRRTRVASKLAGGTSPAKRARIAVKRRGG